MKPHDQAQGETLAMPRTKRITLCVDDFGMHDGVNMSVLTLLAMGRLGATSVLVDGAHVRAGAEVLNGALARMPGQADVGLHLNLSESLSEEHAAAAGFRCPRLPSLIARACARLLPAKSMEAEIHRQCAAFERLFARRPDHVDGHQHVHQLPVVREALLHVLTARYGWDRPWIRSTRPADGTRQFKARVIAALGQRSLARLARLEGFAQNGHLLGAHEFTADPLVYQERIGQWLHESTDGDVLMCHPSTWTARPDALLNQRMTEHDVLAGGGFERQLATAGVVLGRFDDGHKGLLRI